MEFDRKAKITGNAQLTSHQCMYGSLQWGKFQPIYSIFSGRGARDNHIVISPARLVSGEFPNEMVSAQSFLFAVFARPRIFRVPKTGRRTPGKRSLQCIGPFRLELSSYLFRLQSLREIRHIQSTTAFETALKLTHLSKTVYLQQTLCRLQVLQ